MTDLNSLLLDIKRCDEEVKSSHQLLEDAHGLYEVHKAALATAQERFDRAVCEARGVAYAPLPGAGGPTPPAAPEAAQPQYNGPLPPPVPVGGGAGQGNFTDDDNRPEGIGA